MTRCGDGTRASSGEDVAGAQACVMRAVAAMRRWGEAAGDGQEEQDDAIIQVPIEAICNYSADSLAVRPLSSGPVLQPPAPLHACVDPPTRFASRPLSPQCPQPQLANPPSPFLLACVA